jgi:hypothetical protein
VFSTRNAMNGQEATTPSATRGSSIVSTSNTLQWTGTDFDASDPLSVAMFGEMIWAFVGEDEFYAIAPVNDPVEGRKLYGVDYGTFEIARVATVEEAKAAAAHHRLGKRMERHQRLYWTIPDPQAVQRLFEYEDRLLKRAREITDEIVTTDHEAAWIAIWERNQALYPDMHTEQLEAVTLREFLMEKQFIVTDE